jgi:aryl-phospho-beta-D-glucosidase BglC (GH1 family)
MRGSGFVNVRLDRHEYQIFDVGENDWARAKHLRLACEQAFSIAQNMLTRPTLVGEFSVAVNDCDRWLNGYGRGARFDGSAPFGNQPVGSCEPYRHASDFSPSYKAYLREYAERQMRAWDVGLGWVFWNFKTMGGCAPHFDYLLGIKEGYLPPVAGAYKSSCPSFMRRMMV